MHIEEILMKVNVFFLIKDKVVSEKVSNAIEKEFNSEPVCNKQYI